MKICKGMESIEYAVHKDIDFLAYIVSPWHLLGVRAVVEMIKQDNPHAKGVIFICRNHCNEYVISDNHRMQGVEFAYYESDKLSIGLMFDFVKALFYRKNEDKNRRYFIIPCKLDVFLYILYSQKKRENYYTECYVIDEGLGSYLGINIDESADIKKVFDIRGLLLAVRKKMNDFLRVSLELKLKKQSLFYDFSLLMKQNNNRLCINEKVVDYYRHAISSETINVQEDGDIYNDVILINTQPLEGIEDNADVEILRNFCKKCYENGLNVVVKPHPAEKKLEKYNELEQYVKWDLRNNLSQETILNSLEKKPKAIISFDSTTLVTGKIFWDIPSYSLAKILLSRKITGCLKKELTDFINMFSEYIIFCDSIEAFVNVLMQKDK